MDQFAATEKALRMPELLTSVFRCLGPLSWLKCASVCSGWSNAVLARHGEEGGDEEGEEGCSAHSARRPGVGKAPAARTAAATSPAQAPTESSAALPAPAVAAAAVPSAGPTTETSSASEESTAITRAEGKGARSAAAITADLWREFALTVIRYRHRSAARGAGTKASSGCRGGGDGGAPGDSSFYRHVCVEGDPTVLGPPLRAVTAVGGGSAACRGEGKVATVSLADVVAASEARYRRPRALIKFLSLWSRYRHHGSTTPFPTVEVDRNSMSLTYKSPSTSSRKRGGGGGGGGVGRDRRGGAAGSSKTAGAQPSSSSRSSSGSSGSSSGSGTKSSTKRKAKPPSPACCATTTAKLDEALGAFTKLFVLCRRCRRPCTTLYASRDGAIGGSSSRAGKSGGAIHNSGGGKGTAAPTTPSLLAAASTGYGGRGVKLWVECQGDGCGLTSGVGIAAAPGGDGGGGGSGSGVAGPPEWLVRFSRYVMNRSWKDINTLPEDHGTEWFSDTSPAAVQQRQDEARASSIGLEALARRAGEVVGQAIDGDGGSSSSSSSSSVQQGSGSSSDGASIVGE